MNLGFLGTGHIASSVIEGILKSKLKIKKIYISPRNKTLAKKLSKRFKKITISKNNQQLIDSSNWIFLAITPKVGNKILKNLDFKKNKKIISFISTISLSNIKKLTKCNNITRVIPLPFIGMKKGPVIVCPANKSVKNFFNNLGEVIEVKNEEVFKDQNVINLIILIIFSIFLIVIFDKLRIPAALLSGTLLASGILQISEIATYKLSPNIIDYCLLILGASVGCRFANKSFGEIARNAWHSFIATFLLVVLGLVAAFAASLVIEKNFFTLILSYCPGGIYEVAVIAIFFNLDPEFVSFHHIIRLLMILFIVPLILKFIVKKT